MVANQEIPETLKSSSLKTCVVGLFADPERLSDIRRNRVAIMNDTRLPTYTDLESIKEEVEESKILFKRYNWPTICVLNKLDALCHPQHDPWYSTLVVAPLPD